VPDFQSVGTVLRSQIGDDDSPGLFAQADADRGRPVLDLAHPGNPFPILFSLTPGIRSDDTARPILWASPSAPGSPAICDLRAQLAAWENVESRKERAFTERNVPRFFGIGAW